MKGLEAGWEGFWTKGVGVRRGWGVGVKGWGWGWGGLGSGQGPETRGGSEGAEGGRVKGRISENISGDTSRGGVKKAPELIARSYQLVL